MLLLMLVGYLAAKVRRLLRTRKDTKQLRLEEQFVRHGPAPKHVRTCVCRRSHLWTRSLTLKGLKVLYKEAPRNQVSHEELPGHVRACFLRTFDGLRPPPLPVDLIWLSMLGLFWLWVVPESIRPVTSPLTFLSVSLLLGMLVAEVIQAILYADLRSAFDHFADLLRDWTLVRPFDEVFRPVDQKSYRHVLLYRSAMPALSALAL